MSISGEWSEAEQGCMKVQEVRQEGRPEPDDKSPQMPVPFPLGFFVGDKGGEEKCRVRLFPTFYLPENTLHTYVQCQNLRLKGLFWGFSGGAVVENLPANAGDTGSSPGLGGSHMPRSN